MDRVQWSVPRISRPSRGGHPQGDPDRKVLRVADSISIRVEDGRPARLVPEHAIGDRPQCVARTHHVPGRRRRGRHHGRAGSGGPTTGSRCLAGLDNDAVIARSHAHCPAGGHEPHGEHGSHRDPEWKVRHRGPQHDGHRAWRRRQPDPGNAEPRARSGAGLDANLYRRRPPQHRRAPDRICSGDPGGAVAPRHAANGEGAAAARTTRGNPARVTNEELAARAEDVPAAIGRRRTTAATVAGQEGCGGRHCTRRAESPSMAPPVAADNERGCRPVAVSRRRTAGRAAPQPRSRPR